MDFAAVASRHTFRHICQRSDAFRSTTLVVAQDILKVFDKVCYDSLLSKVIAFGVSGDFSRFISSYFRDRTIRVVIGGV